MDWWMVLAGLLIVVLLVVLWRMRSRARGADGTKDADRLDTVASWPPAPMRVLSAAERIAYKTLARALPGHMILAKVPLARFLKVPSRHSYAEWLRRLGHQCADFVVCDMSSEVIAVISVRPPVSQTSERSRKRHQRLARAMKAARIPLHEWTENAFPTPDRAREALLPAADGASAAGRPPAAPAPSRPAVLDAIDRAEADTQQDDPDKGLEPPPSTWFDDFNSGPGALLPPKPKA